MQPRAILNLILLLSLANGAPIIAKKICGQRLSRPLDGGAIFLDRKPLLGPSKTVRGLLASVLVTAAVAPFVGLDRETGVRVAVAAMAGDLFSSFVKRRLNLPSSSQMIGIDQIPESLLPLLACRSALSLQSKEIAWIVGLFFVGELIVSRLLYRIHLRDEPY